MLIKSSKEHFRVPLFGLLVIFISFFGCKTEKGSYDVIRKTKTISKEHCTIPVSFPQIENLDTAETLNNILENIPEHEYYARNCKNGDNDRFDVKGEYDILLKTDSLLSVEFRTLIKREKIETDTIYHAIVLNPNKKKASESYQYITNIEDIIPNFNREMLYPYIEKNNLKHKKNTNLLAYKKGSNYAITWAVSMDNLIIYTGGEGEMFGYDRIYIPLKALKK